MIEIFSATRYTKTGFWSKSALGISLQRLSYDTRLVPRIAFENRQGLPQLYNARLHEKNDIDMIVFIHDDVWIDDYFIADRIIEGLQKYDVIGIAGNKRRVSRQPGWAFIDTKFSWDDKANLSGSVAHGKHPFGNVSNFGPTPADCELLDGVFLAMKKSTITAHQVMFDPRFDFHFYDMDFCRSARMKGLRLGTWPLCMTHQSGGAFGTPAWLTKYNVYLEKWEAPAESIK